MENPLARGNLHSGGEKMSKYHGLCAVRYGKHVAHKAPLMVIALAAGLFAGCLSRPALTRQLFTFATPATRSSAGPKNGRVLAIRHISVAAPFAGQSFVYRTGELAYEQDPYAQFLVVPEENLQEPLRGYLLNSGQFEAVTEPGSALKPTLLVEISVPQLYGDFLNRTEPAAVLEISFTFFGAPNGLPDKMISQKSYHQRIPLKARTAAALMAGWNEALRRIMDQAAHIAAM